MLECSMTTFRRKSERNYCVCVWGGGVTLETLEENGQLMVRAMQLA